jgi:hypothetical protein
VAENDREKHPDEKRIAELMDRLAAILRAQPPDRQAAFLEMLNEQIEREAEDAGRDAADSDREER